MIANISGITLYSADSGGNIICWNSVTSEYTSQEHKINWCFKKVWKFFFLQKSQFDTFFNGFCGLNLFYSTENRRQTFKRFQHK